MPDYKNPIDGSEYRDKQHVETTLYEYRSMYVGKQYDVKRGRDYLGTVSQIYDNVHGNEEQFFIFTNFYQWFRFHILDKNSIKMIISNINPNPFSHFR